MKQKWHILFFKVGSVLRLNVHSCTQYGFRIIIGIYEASQYTSPLTLDVLFIIQPGRRMSHNECRWETQILLALFTIYASCWCHILLANRGCMWSRGRSRGLRETSRIQRMAAWEEKGGWGRGWSDVIYILCSI